MFAPGILQYSSAVVPTGSFIFEISVTAGSSTLFTLQSGTTYDFYVDWGDGTSESHVTSRFGGPGTHTYASGGTYEVSIRGQCESIIIGNDASGIVNWGETGAGFSGFYYFRLNSNQITDLTATDGTSIQSIPATASGGCTNFRQSFQSCTSLTTMPNTLFDLHTNIAADAFRSTFQGCTSLTTVPSGLFDTAVNASTYAFSQTFYGCTSFNTIPTDLFRYNTLVSGIYCFNNTFGTCTSLNTIPTDLFRYNTLAGGFIGTFYQARITSIPQYTFRYNVNATTFQQCFIANYWLVINEWIFCAPGEESTRFLNQSVNFLDTFAVQFSFAAAGSCTAPTLWAYDYGTGTPTPTRCFRGYSATQVTNWASVPAAWR